MDIVVVVAVPLDNDKAKALAKLGFALVSCERKRHKDYHHEGCDIE